MRNADQIFASHHTMKAIAQRKSIEQKKENFQVYALNITFKVFAAGGRERRMVTLLSIILVR